MFVLAGLRASAGEFDLSDMVEAIRREGWRNEGFLAASPEPGRVCCTGMLTAAVLCLLIDTGVGSGSECMIKNQTGNFQNARGWRLYECAQELD